MTLHTTIRRATTATLFALLCALGFASSALATSPGSNGDLIYSSGGSIRSIDLANPDAQPVTLNSGPGAHNPMVSPDGTQIAYGIRIAQGLTAIAVSNIDGTGQRILTTPGTSPAEYDGSPSWSPDGEKIVFERQVGTEPVTYQVRVLTVDGGGDGSVAVEKTNGPFIRTEWSPEGSKIAVEQRASEGSFSTTRNDLFLVSPTGGSQLLRQGPVLAEKEYPGGRRLSWSPDGKRLAYAPQDGTDVLFYTLSGANDGELSVFGSNRIGAVTYTNDGAHLLIQRCATRIGDCRIWQHQVPPPGPEVEYDPTEPKEMDLGPIGPATDRTISHFDMQPQTQPIIFVHGFAGSNIACGIDELWPPTGRSEDDVLDMRLADDGISNAPQTCGAAPTTIVTKAYGQDVYGSTEKFLQDVAPDNHEIFVWDWRKDPRDQVLGLNTVINDWLNKPLQKKQGVDKVVLYGHSMGGQVIRNYIDDPQRAKKVSRVVTAGTPYLGAPKAILPLAQGIEVPGGTGALDRLLVDSAFRELAKNLTGMYFLYPSEAFGPWLTVKGRTPSPLDRQGIEDFVAFLGGNRNLFNRAQDGHAQTIDGFKRNGVDYRAFVGIGLPTVGSVRYELGENGSENALEVNWDNGDGTVPVRSGAQGPIDGPPLGENVPISFVCGVAHVPLPGDPKVTTPIKDFLLYGTPPLKTRESCRNKGLEHRFNGIEIGTELDPSVSLRGTSTMSIEQAADDGMIELLDMPGEPIVATSDDMPVSFTANATNARMMTTPIEGEGERGDPVFYGPVTGELTVTTAADGLLTVTDDGATVPARTERQPGDPGSGGSASDTDPPETAAISGPAKIIKTTTKKAKVRFEFSSDEAGTFECELDGKTVTPCSSPLTTKVAAGKHVMEVSAVDAAGNVDESPARWSFKVKRRR